MLEAYIAAGFVPETFWKLTPKLYWIYMKGARVRLVQDHNRAAWLAWHSAYLPRTQKPVKLASMLIEVEGMGKTRKTWEQQYQQWVAYCKQSKRGRGR